MKTKPVILILGLSCIFIGLIFAIPEVLSLHKMPNIEEAYVYRYHSYVYQIESQKDIYFKDVEIIYDDTLTDEILIQTAYYEPFIESVAVKAKDNMHYIKIDVIANYHFNLDNIQETYDKIVKDLKEKYIYNYQDLLVPKTTIRLNQKYKNIVKISS